jgi:5-methylcytosine-specific restriction protein B
MEIIDNFKFPAEEGVQFWAVGSSFGRTEDQTKDFIKNNYWRDGWGLVKDERNKETLMHVKKGDILIMKSSSTKGTDHKLSFTKVKAIGRITGKANYYTFLVKWFDTNPFPKDFDSIWYSKTIEKMRADELLEFAKDFIKTAK